MTRRIIKLDPELITYKYGYHGYYYDDHAEKWYNCHVLSDETFIRLWFKCTSIQQFRDSYEANHKNGYRPSEASCRSRAKNIQQRLKVSLPALRNETKDAAEAERERLRRLVVDLKECCQEHLEQVDPAAPVIQ